MAWRLPTDKRLGTYRSYTVLFCLAMAAYLAVFLPFSNSPEANGGGIAVFAGVATLLVQTAGGKSQEDEA